MDIEELKAKFIKAYAAIPSAKRQEIAAVLGAEPFTWAAIFVEVSGNTEKSKELLLQLEKMKII